MFGAELVIVLLAIYLGARLGGYRHRFLPAVSGVLVLTLIFQIKPGAIPFDVIEIIMQLLPLSPLCRWQAVWTTW